MKVALDVDGVLANFYGTFCERFSEPIERVSHWDSPVIVRHINKIKDDHNFWANLWVLNGPDKIDFEFDYYITHVPEGVSEARKEWLIKNGFPDKPVIISGDKKNVALELGVKFLIDDKPSTMHDFKEHSDLVGIQYVPEYSDMPILGDHCVHSLGEVNGILNLSR